MRKMIQQSVDSAIEAVQALKEPQAVGFIEKAATIIGDAFLAGRKLLVAGNGGSLCDAMHFAEELTGYFRKKRKAFPAIALSDPGHLTCVSNDTCFDQVFARGVEAFGKKGDVLAVLTTSGNSKNIVLAALEAKKRGLTTIAFLGKDGGELKGVCDEELIISGFPFSDRVQEAHMVAIHIMIETIEKRLFSPPLETLLKREAIG